MNTKMDTQGAAMRPATPADLSALGEIYAATGLDGGERLSPDDARKAFARLAAYPEYTVYVSEDPASRAVIATYSLTIVDTLIRGGRPFALVEQVAVRPDCQGRGLGREMMDHAMEIARVRGCYKLMLSSHVDLTLAHAFYERLGFTRHGYSFVVDL